MIRFKEIGQRLRAYRLGAGFKAEQVAERLEISRAAVYRLEKGELIKIETLERVGELLEVSLPSLLGVGVEYYARAVAYFERMRQCEEEAEQILAYFEPVSFLLTSKEYPHCLRQMLLESIPESAPDPNRAEAEVEAVMSVLCERKMAGHRPGIVSLIGSYDIERFLHIGLVGRLDLPSGVVEQRRRAARREVEHIAALMEQEPIGVQIGVVEDAMPRQTFQIFRGSGPTMLGVSPFRLGELPNIRSGIATVTSSPEAVMLYERMMTELWDRARKGAQGAALLRQLADQSRRAIARA